MSDYKFPELPSDEELGITDEDREQYAKDFPDDGPELSDAEMAALLGESPKPRGKPETKGKSGGKAKPAADDGQSDARARAAKQVRKAEKKQTKEEEKASKQARRDAKAKARDEKAAAKQEQKAARAAEAAERKAAVQAEVAAPAWRGPVTLAALVLMVFASSTRVGLPRPVPANASDTVFSSARALATLVDIARRPHPTGSPEHERVRGILVDQLRQLGFEPEIQTATSLMPREPYLTPAGDAPPTEAVRSATVRNVVARRPGTDPTGTVLFTAHYDSREIAVGAGDDATGVVAILEALRALDAGGEPLENNLIVLFTDAEELGLLGARAFVDQHPWMDDVDIVVSFEMRGAGGTSIMFETNELQGLMARTVAGFSPGPFATSLAYEVYRRMSRDTDFTPFKEAGVQGLNFAAIGNAHVYHQPYDVPEEVSARTVQHHGENALDALRAFGSMDLGEVNAPNRAYMTLPALGMVHYAAPFVHAVSALLLLLFAAFVTMARKGGARPIGMAGGLGLGVIAFAAAWFGGGALVGRVMGWHPEAGALQGSLFHAGGWYLLAIAWGMLALLAAALPLARRWITRDELAVGVLVLPAVAAVATGVVAPLGAMHLQWPVIAALLGCITLHLLGARSGGMVGWLAALLVALPVAAILVPVVELVWMALTLRLAGGLAVVITIGLLLCLPALSALRAPNAWWAPALSCLLAAASIGVGGLVARPDAATPIPTTLVWAYEHGSGEAIWATAPVAENPGRAENDGALWAEARAGGSFDETRDLAGFGYPFGLVPVRRGPVVSAEPPEVLVTRDSLVGSERRVRLAVRSRIRAEHLGFLMEPGTTLRALNGVPIADADAVRMADHWGVPEEAVTLDLTMPSDSPIGVQVIEHLLRPEEILGEGAFERPAEMAANVNRMSDRAMLRYSVAAFADPRHALLASPGVADSVAAPDTSAAPGVSSPTDSVTVSDSSTAADTAGVIDTTGATDTAGSPPGVAVEPDTSAIPTEKKRGS